MTPQPAARGKWRLAVAGGVALLLLLAGAGTAYVYQKEKISKIEFIFWDREHENEANLSPGEIAAYVRACGGKVESVSPVLVARYDGWFEHRRWSLATGNSPRGGKSS